MDVLIIKKEKVMRCPYYAINFFSRRKGFPSKNESSGGMDLKHMICYLFIFHGFLFISSNHLSKICIKLSPYQPATPYWQPDFDITNSVDITNDSNDNNYINNKSNDIAIKIKGLQRMWYKKIIFVYKDVSICK